MWIYNGDSTNSNGNGNGAVSGSSTSATPTTSTAAATATIAASSSERTASKSTSKSKNKVCVFLCCAFCRLVVLFPVSVCFSCLVVFFGQVWRYHFCARETSDTDCFPSSTRNEQRCPGNARGGKQQFTLGAVACVRGCGYLFVDMTAFCNSNGMSWSYTPYVSLRHQSIRYGVFIIHAKVSPARNLVIIRQLSL